VREAASGGGGGGGVKRNKLGLRFKPVLPPNQGKRNKHLQNERVKPRGTGGEKEGGDSAKIPIVNNVNQDGGTKYADWVTEKGLTVPLLIKTGKTSKAWPGGGRSESEVNSVRKGTDDPERMIAAQDGGKWRRGQAYRMEKGYCLDSLLGCPCIGGKRDKEVQGRPRGRMKGVRKTAGVK